MARLSAANATASAAEPTSINLARLLVRLQQVLNSHDPDVESKLRSSSIERERIGTNIEYARALLLKLEQDSLNIKTQNRKQEIQIDLVKKRDTLQILSERLQEFNELAEPETEEDSSEGEDLLGEDTPSEETDEHTTQIEHASPPDGGSTPQSRESESHSPHLEKPQPNPADEEPHATLRSRNPHPAAESAYSGTATSTGISTATAESLLTHNRAEQEALTNSLVSMASALKESSKAFASTLESEKSTLDRAVEGLDRNELGLEAASKRMGYLRSMTEGKGWWGRMMMYAWIAGLMVLAILIVFVGPKLRF